MKQNKLIPCILAALILLTAVLALLHFQTRDRIPEGALLVSCQGRTEAVELDRLSLTEISGTLLNGKGEEKPVSGQGVALFSLASGEVQSATVTAAEEYSATVGLEDAENAWLLLGEDGSARLIVFGDLNARRDVKRVVKVVFS